MSGEQRAILSMIAAGHISPREGERLLAVADNAEERWAWLAALGALAWLAWTHQDAVLHAATLCAQTIGGLR